MPTYVALLRGINVGGKHKLPMKDLTELYVKAGCSQVKTYIQSGNVVFQTKGSAEPVCAKVSAAIEKTFGFSPPIILRTTDEMEKVTRNNPFLKAGAPEVELHVLFLADVPKRADVESLSQYSFPPDEFIVRGKEVYLRLPNGFGTSKLAAMRFDAKLHTVVTARNWRTVNQLLEIMKSFG
jgi:uncharacterized protein (DUF1697 family)